MFRFLAVGAILLAACAVPSQAQFVRIKINFQEFNNPGQSAPVNPNGGYPGGGLPGAPGAGGPGEGAGGGPAEGGPGGGYPGGGYPGGGYPGSGAGAKKDDGPPPIWMEVWIPYDKNNSESYPPRTQNAPYAKIVHQWGASLVPYENIYIIKERPIRYRYVTIRKQVPINGSTAEQLYNKAVWTLKHGMIDEFVATMEGLGKRFPNRSDVKTFQKVRERMNKAVSKNDPTSDMVAKKLRDDGYSSYQNENGHYTLFSRMNRESNVRGKKTKDPIDERFEQLERTYQSFYYWFALQGIELPQPDYRLVAVLERTPTEYKLRHNFFCSDPMVEDGFTARRDNVIFLSPSPMDSQYGLLAQNNQSHWTNFGTNLTRLFEFQTGGFNNMDTYARVSTMALIQKAMEKDVERSATTHEAIRQLLIASDLLPRNIATAEWLRYGLASFFETPRHSLFDSSAIPSRTNLMNYKIFRKSKKLANGEGGNVLLTTVTDRYFSVARQAYQTLPETGKKRDKAEAKAREQLEMAQATSWALTYYLMNNKLGSVIAYTEELKKLPRDVEFDASVLAAAFGRAFGMTANSPTTLVPVDMSQAQALGNAWFSAIDDVQLDVHGIESIVMHERFAPPEKKKPKQPPRGGSPGGYPGGYPGGGFPPPGGNGCN